MVTQTWEDPEHFHDNWSMQDAEGDNDPLDAVELSSTSLPIGSLHTVKVLVRYILFIRYIEIDI